jgi:deoxyribonuclease V
MKLAIEHRWDLSPEEAKALQEKLRSRVKPETELGQVRTVAGVDVGFKDDVARAAVVVLDYESLEPLDQAVAEQPVTFPYIPGLLAFREVPAVLAALENLHTEPDMYILDGHGWAHPRRMGLACHLGVILDRPSIGCAKSRLIGSFQEPGREAGAWTRLYDGDEVIGAVVRTRSGVSPVFVSIGHRVDLPTAVEMVLRCCRGYRLPETSRLAHLVAGGTDVIPRATQPSLFDL